MLFLLNLSAVSEARTGKNRISDDMSKIKSVVFINKTATGYGGMITVQPVPVVLFKNGDACKSTQAVVYKKGISAHKRKNPKLWTKWKIKDGKLWLKNKSRWQKVPYKRTYGPMKQGQRLNDSYSRITGTGNTVMGGKSKVTAVENFVFSKDGRFLHKGAAAGHVGFDDGYRKPKAEGHGKSRLQKGRYTIDGYILTLKHDNGHRSRNFIVADPKNPKAIWINGKGYASN
jgi:hypothetical protein